MIIRPLRALALLAPVLLAACSGGSSGATARPTTPVPTTPAASAPAPGVTLPPDALVGMVLSPDQVPAGMVLAVKGSGPRSLDVVAGYSGAAATAAAAAKLRTHGFTSAYVAQYVNPGNGQVLSVLASSFATASGAAADFADDVKAPAGTRLTVATLGEASAATTQDVPGKVVRQLVLLRFRRGTTTWSLAYQAPKPADPAVAVDLAKALLARVPV